MLKTLTVMMIAAASLTAQSDNAAWKKLEFLLGDWKGGAGEKDTPLGAGQGAFSFQPQLNRKIIVRHNNATYDSGVTHDDLMVIYLDAPDTPRAIYFDTEGHVIHYKIAFPSTSAVTFESDAAQAGPKYRLSYWVDHDQLKGKFEVASPGAEYKTYLTWSAVRK